MRKCGLIFALATILCITLFSSCSSSEIKLDPAKPITLTMWHNFGGEMQKTMDTLIDEFNSTVGSEKGIIINVTAISSSSELQNNLNMIINGDPGSPQLPDITTCYPKTAVLLHEKNMISNLDEYFTADEQASYVPQFIEEGRFNGGLFVFPFAKSTEILYLNQTLFDSFAAENPDITMSCFDTFEGIADAAIKYYDWTNAQTPEIEGDGKAFFAADSWLNLAQSCIKQQGQELFADNKLSLKNDTFKRIWDTCFAPSDSGGFAIYDGYSSDLSKTGDLICSTGSSAGILFYGDTITYKDNTIQQVEYSILPYPIISGGTKTAIQRGNGLCVAKSEPQREYAASIFLKWFTEEKQNMRFIASTGYLPVTNSAFTNGIKQQINEVNDYRIKKMLYAVTEMYESYDFFTAPVFNEFDSIGKSFEGEWKTVMKNEEQQSANECLDRFIGALKD